MTFRTLMLVATFFATTSALNMAFTMLPNGEIAIAMILHWFASVFATCFILALEMKHAERKRSNKRMGRIPGASMDSAAGDSRGHSANAGRSLEEGRAG